MNTESRWPKIYAHRGASGYYVENTMTAFQKALELGADGLESDVWVTKDGTAYLYHDKTIQLKSNSDQPIQSDKIAVEQISEIILPNQEKVPTLNEFFEQYAGKKNKYGDLIPFSIDIQHLKAGPAAAKLAQEFECEEQLYLCASSAIYFKKVRNVSQRVHLVASNVISRITKQTYNWAISPFKRYNIEIFNIKAADFQPEYKDLFSRIYIWDLHTEDRLRTYLPYCPEAIYSNYPDLAVKIREEIWALKHS
jgi:glycerophosphoryl diester phosphodiesterase